MNDRLEAIDLVLLRPPVLSRASEPMPMLLGTLGALHLPTALTGATGWDPCQRWPRTLPRSAWRRERLGSTSAGLFLRSVAAAGRAPLGFADPHKVLLAATDLSFTRLEGEALATLVDRALESVRALPGVEHAALASIVPLSFGAPAGVQIKVEGHVPGANESMFVGRGLVTDGYFATLQMAPSRAAASFRPIARAASGSSS